jgi:hypothetical protein
MSTKKVPLSIASVTFRVQAIVENLGNLLGDQKLLGHFFTSFCQTVLFGPLQLHFSQLSYDKNSFCNYRDRLAQNRKTKYVLENEDVEKTTFEIEMQQVNQTCADMYF